MSYNKPFTKTEYEQRVNTVKQRMQAGMCFHFQSGMWLDDFGAAISEPFIVTDNGGERLCDVARELIVIE
jgi:Xaa-Pro aminopeptidase